MQPVPIYAADQMKRDAESVFFLDHSPEKVQWTGESLLLNGGFSMKLFSGWYIQLKKSFKCFQDIIE